MESTQSFSDSGEENTVLSQFPPPPPELLEEADEMVAAERELAEDAQWKKIQQNTFTRWVNEHLKTVSKHCGNLETDLADGLRLLALVEVLSGKRIPRFNKRPMIISQKIENVTIALKFLETDEGIKLVNIDSSDITDCKLKLILGLIWTLILHYSISLPMWDGEPSGEKGPTPKQRLLGWIQNKVPDLPIHNFTTDWNDGRAVGALVDAVAPGLCPDWPDWSPKDALQNATEAMGLADDWLRIPQLIKPEEMIDPKVDELSMMTYLSQYPHAKVQPGAPLRPRTNPGRVRVYGPGVEPTGPVVGAPAPFSIETFAAGKGNVEVAVQGPTAEILPVDLKFNNDRSLTYSASYTPKQEGPHRIVVRFAEKDVPRSPFDVKVEGFAGDASKVTVSGPGVEQNGVIINRPTYFDIFTKEAGKGTPEVALLDGSGQRSNQVKLRPISQDVWRCEYVAQQLGLHSVNVFFAGKPVPGSPFGVKVSPVSDARRVRAWGRGLQPTGVRVKDTADFKIYTEGAGEGNMDIKIIGPGGIAEPVKIRRIDSTTYEASYQPKKEGRYVAAITYGGQEIPRSPFEVTVGPYKESRIVAFGPGLEGGVVGHPALFTVETNGETGALGFSIEGPSQAKIECQDNNDGSADVRYYPSVPGDYAVHIMCNNEDIPGSPFMATVLPSTVQYHPDKVIVKGPGLEKHGLISNQPTDFKVDTRQAGSAPVAISVMDREYRPIDVKITESVPGVHECSYVPKKGVKHTVQVNHGGVATTNSPYRVFVSDPTDPNKVRVFGPGVERGVKTKTPTHFNIDCRDAGPGEIQVTITNEKGQEVQMAIIDNQDGSYTAEYAPLVPGKHTVTVLYAGKPAPQTPIQVVVSPHVDIDKVRVDGLESSVFVESPTEFVVDSRDVGTGRLQCILTSPSGTRVEAPVTPLADGQHKVIYTPFEEGRHHIDVMYDGVPIPGSPFPVTAQRGCDPRKCKAYGPGLLRGVVDQNNAFTVETKGAGAGGLGLAIEGPSEARMTCKDNRDGSCTVEYIPLEEGDYDISVKFAEQHITGSPFKVSADRVADPNAVRAYGPGLDPKNCRSGVPQKFRIDASKSGKAPLAVEIKSDKGQVQQKPEVKDNGDGTYDVTYVPPPEGSNCKIRVTHAGKDIPKSPFDLRVRPKVEPNNVKVTGPGVSSKGVPASLPVDFTIDTTEAGFADLEVQVLGPDGYPRKVKIADNGDGTFKATYVPDDCGQYKVKVKYGGKEVPHAPFPVQGYAIGKAERCQITEGKQQALTLGEEYCITVNAKQAGHGAVTCKIRSTQGSDLDIDIEDNGDGTFSIFYNVKDAGEYTISVKFGGQPVPDGFYTLKAGGEEFAKQTSAPTQNHARNNVEDQYRPVELQNIPLPSTGGNVTAEVRMPSGTQDSPMIVDNRDGTVSIRYEPREEGLHELHVKYNSEHVQGSPFKFHVDQISSGLVTAYGSGLTHGICGEQCKFTISTQGAGAAGGLSLAVEGPSKAEISCHDNKDGTVSVSYLPTAPGEYKIAVKFADKHIKGSPYTAKITGEGRRRNQISVGSSSEVPLPGRVTDAELKLLSATIQSPTGFEEPCFLKRLPNGNLGVSFTPREAGDHHVSVKKMGKHIANSPFKISVGEKQVGDARKVKLSGAGLKEGKTHAPNTFKIDTRDAGYGGLSLSIEGPSKAEIDCKDNEDGTLDISYKPTEPGYYIVNLKFADHHVEGSPFTVKVTGEGSNKQTERIKKQRDAVPVTEVGSKCRLQFKLPGVTPKDLGATVASPKGIVEDCSILPTEDDGFAVDFVPKELGVHTVSVKFRDMHIPGSPFQFTVGPLKESGSHRVRAGGPGLERGEVGESCDFNVWTREAGAGSLAISVEGPSKAEIDFQDRKDGSCYVSYKVTEPGEYRVGIKFNELNIPDSPYRVYITPASGDAHKIEIGQFPEKVVKSSKPQAFIVRKCGARGDFDAKVVSPSGVEDDCFISPIVEDETYSVRFVPQENGIHYIHVKFNGVHIRGSPFKLKVGDEDADPAAIKVIGDGISKSVSGQKSEFIIDTTGTGTGTLAVTIDGPSKVAVNCTEVEEGYKVRYTPLLPGDYYISVKYNGGHIPNSPFKVVCTGDKLAEVGVQETSSVIVETVKKYAKGVVVGGRALPVFKSDASKVTCKGMGLKKSYLNKQNTFSVQGGEAGNNMLFCSVYGPKGPVEEVFIKHIGRNNYNVNYVARDKGEHIIALKWGEEHVPGSPWRVDVL